MNIITREEWGAEKPRRKPESHRPLRIVIHHSYRPTASDYMAESSTGRKKTILGIQRYHVHENGWNDIGYHFLVGPDGSVYAGRSPDTIGSHCGGKLPDGVRRIFGNAGSIGICLIGDYDRESPSAVMLSALNELIGDLMDRYGIDTTQIRGHFEAWNRPTKTCPGRNLVPLIAALNPRLLEAWSRAYPTKAGA